MCRLSTDLVCLGSRLGDTLLIKFTPKVDPAKSIKSEPSENGNAEDENGAEPPGKRMRISQDSDDLFEKEEKSELNFLEDSVCIFLIYIFFIFLKKQKKYFFFWWRKVQEDSAAQATTLQYTFAVWESIMNLGPISDSIVGESQDPASNSHNGIPRI